MLTKLLAKLQNYNIVLASQSPRRLELLTNLGIQFQVIPSLFEETLNTSDFETPDLYVIENAKQKALEVSKRTSVSNPDQIQTPYVIIGADTVVVLDGQILEKPKDTAHAFDMLSELSGREHTVYSGVTLLHRTSEAQEEQLHCFYEKTSVQFGELSPETIDAYIATGEPMDKAGGYGIQGTKCSSFIQRIDGCYNNVIGFPVHEFCKQLQHLLLNSK